MRLARPRPVDLRLAAVLFLVALAVRLPELRLFLTPDETRWICRSTNFYAALETGELGRTYQKEHPGVLTMWLGSLGRDVDPADDVATACRDIPASKLVGEASPETLAGLRERLFDGRRAVVVVVSLGIAAMYLLAAPLVGPAAAGLGAGLTALDPLHIGQSRVLHIDALTTTFMTLSLLALLLHLLVDRRRRLLVLSGVLGGLAALNRSPAAFMAPFVLVAAAAAWSDPGGNARRGEVARRVAIACAVWGAAAAATFVALWPAMWVAPVDTIVGVLRGAVGYAEDPHEGSNYFWGAIRPDPGPLFYPVAWLFRATPVVLAGVVAALAEPARALAARLSRPGAVAPDGDRASEGDVGVHGAAEAHRRSVVYLLAYALLFTMFMSTGAKKFDRYLLPIFPAMCLVAGAGLVSLAAGARTVLASRGRREAAALALPVAVAVALLLQLAQVMPHRPYFLSYYDPLLGGARGATWAMLVGWGEGLEQAAAWLNDQPGADALTVATRYRSAVGPLLRGRAMEMDDFDPATLDYYLLYVNQVQRDLDPELIARLRTSGPADFEARFQGISYAWVYENDNFAPAVELVAERATEGDVVLTRCDTRFHRLYRDGVPSRSGGRIFLLCVSADAAADEIESGIQAALPRAGRLWYVRYDDVFARPGLAGAEFRLATSTYRLVERRFPEVSVWALARPPEEDVSVAPGATPDPLADDRPAAGKMDAAYGRSLALDGYALVGAPIQWGRALGVRLSWRATGAVGRDVTAFVHLVDGAGNRLAQADVPILAAADARTGAWSPGTRGESLHHLWLPVGTPLGEYRLLVGAYDASSGERLPLVQDGRSPAENVATIPVEVERSPYQPDPRDLGEAP